MAYGMTYEAFWDGDVCAHRAYRKAHEISIVESNTNAWLHGRYVYDALCAVAPVLRAFSKARSPSEYLEKPYDLFEEQRKQRELERQEKERQHYEHIKEKVAAFAKAFNEQRNSEGKEAVDDGSSRGN